MQIAQFKSLILRLKLPILSGVLIGTSYIPFPPWASLFCFVPLWIYWTQQSRLSQILWGGVTSAFVFTLIGFNWVTYTLHEFAHLDWWISNIFLKDNYYLGCLGKFNDCR